MRHYCNLDDDLEVWGWEEHDGMSYGKQTIVDSSNNLKMQISVYMLNGKLS